MSIKPFKALQIEPTSRCQLKCVMCPRTAFPDDWMHGDMPLSVYKKLAESFHLAEHIHLQGWGEPLLHAELFQMMNIAKACGCRVSLTTNGVLLTPSVSERLLCAGLDIITISIAGATRLTHESIRCGSSFSQLVENIKELSRLKSKAGLSHPVINLSFLLTKDNITELSMAVSLAKDLGADRLIAANIDYTPDKKRDTIKAFSCNKPEEFGAEQVWSALKKAREIDLAFRSYPLSLEEAIICELDPLHIISISHDGSVAPCVYLNLPKKGSTQRIFCDTLHEFEKVCFGNINSEDLMTIWHKPGYNDFRKCYTERINLLNKIESASDPSEAYEVLKKELKHHALHYACRTCYKAYCL